MSNYVRVFEDNTYVFITIVTNTRASFLIDKIDLLKKSFINSKRFYEYTIFAIVILPNHIHMIIKPKKIEDYPKIVSIVKHYFSRRVPKNIENISESKILKREKGVWQRRYWEHTIRDESDLYKRVDYIHYNPVKHNYVNSVKDWEHSSFNRFVENGFYDIDWGSSQDIENIKDMDLE